MKHLLTKARPQPSFFIPHGGGPCFFMDDPRHKWSGMATFLRLLPSRLPATPSAILLVSGHWETNGFAFTGADQPPLVYDYFGFPPETYQLRYDVPGSPSLANRATALLEAAGLTASVDGDRGLDHGVFIPLKVAFPDATVPVVEMSVDLGLSPAQHLAAGKALTPLRDEGVLIIASGMSFHNMRGYGNPAFTEASVQFDAWLSDTLAQTGHNRAEALEAWETAPAARLCHPEAEHLLPLMVAVGAADASPGEHIYQERVLEVEISGYRFS